MSNTFLRRQTNKPFVLEQELKAEDQYPSFFLANTLGSLECVFATLGQRLSQRTYITACNLPNSIQLSIDKYSVTKHQYISFHLLKYYQIQCYTELQSA